jgi:hypothetical protein
VKFHNRVHEVFTRNWGERGADSTASQQVLGCFQRDEAIWATPRFEDVKVRLTIVKVPAIEKFFENLAVVTFPGVDVIRLGLFGLSSWVILKSHLEISFI